MGPVRQGAAASRSATLLGGRSRDSIRVYNTCAGYRYIRDARAQTVANWHAGATDGPYEDLDGFLHRADELALSLLEQGITGMKIWPFDIAAERSGGYDISPGELDTALEPFAKIRKAVGDRMDIMVEFHSLWSLPMAKKLARAAGRVRHLLARGSVPPRQRRRPRATTRRTPRPGSAPRRRSPTRTRSASTSQTGVAGVAMLDLSWCGGLTEARKIAALAEAWHVPVAPHDCTGPVVYTASCHFSLHARNALIQETVRAFYTGWYTELVTDLPVVTRGEVSVGSAPGLGLELLPGIERRADAIRRVSDAG